MIGALISLGIIMATVAGLVAFYSICEIIAQRFRR
jgi:hypothetical protein